MSDGHIEKSQSDASNCAVLNFISTRAIIVMENLVLSPQESCLECDVVLPKVAKTLSDKPPETPGNRVQDVLSEHSGTLKRKASNFSVPSRDITSLFFTV